MSASEGEIVNSHVIPQQKQPEPDFEAMRRVIAGTNDKRGNEPEKRAVTENNRAAKPIVSILG